MNYSSKKKIISKILQDGPYEFPLDKEKRKFVEQYMIDYHVHVESLTIDKLWIQSNEKFKHNNFYYNGTLNGTTVYKRLLGTSSTSANKINNKIEDKRLAQAMREAISQDLFEYKKFMMLYEDIHRCEICSEKFDLSNTNDIHVDHCGDKEFRHIKDEFLSVNPNLIVIDRDENDAGLTKLLDNEDKELWIEFHHHSCSLQLICKKCNLSKAKA